MRWRVGEFEFLLIVDGKRCRCQRWRQVTMATMMMLLSALEAADNGNDDVFVVSAGVG